MARNPRDPKAVRKLIADAQQRQAADRKRQVDNAVVRFVKRIIASDEARRNGNGSGTRNHRRDS